MARRANGNDGGFGNGGSARGGGGEGWGRHAWTAALFALAALVCLLWVRSRTTFDAFVLFVGGEGRAEVLGSAEGRVYVVLTNVAFGRERAWTALCAPGVDVGEMIANDVDPARLQIYPPPDPAKVAAGGSPFGDGYLGFAFASSQSAVVSAVPRSQLVYVMLPHWSVAVPLLAWAAWRAFGPAAERHRRLRKGQCLNCGYDLRASEGRCPECGVGIEKPAPESGPVTSAATAQP